MDLPALLPRKEGICDICQFPLEKRPDDCVEMVDKRLKNFEIEELPVIEAFEMEKLIPCLHFDTVGSQEDFNRLLHVILSTI